MILVIRKLLSFLFAVATFSYAADIGVHWTGNEAELKVHIAAGDNVIFTAAYSPFTISSGSYTLATDVYMYAQNYYSLGETSFSIIDSIGRVGYGRIIASQYPKLFNSTKHSYDVNVGEFIRWQWNSAESPPPVPSYIFGEYYYNYPLPNRSGFDFHDIFFLIPGWYGWYSSWDFYQVQVHDPNYMMNHTNILWGNRTYTTNNYFGPQTSLVFYNADGQTSNVRVVNTKTNDLVWISQDMHHVGDFVIAAFPPGNYIATSSYTFPYPHMKFTVMGDSNPGSVEFKIPYIPKSVLFVAEFSLFLVGAIGLGNYLIDKVKDIDIPGVPKLPLPDISISPRDGTLSTTATATAADQKNLRSTPQTKKSI